MTFLLRRGEVRAEKLNAFELVLCKTRECVHDLPLRAARPEAAYDVNHPPRNEVMARYRILGQMTHDLFERCPGRQHCIREQCRVLASSQNIGPLIGARIAVV